MLEALSDVLTANAVIPYPIAPIGSAVYRAKIARGTVEVDAMPCASSLNGAQVPVRIRIIRRPVTGRRTKSVQSAVSKVQPVGATIPKRSVLILVRLVVF